MFFIYLPLSPTSSGLENLQDGTHIFRSFNMKLNFLVSLLGLLLAPSAAAPTESPASSSLMKRLPAFQFYFDVTPAQHQANFNEFAPAGYRMVSLDVYGLPPNHRYAAVWVQRSGPAYIAISDASAAEYQTWFDTYAADGFVTTLLSTTGTAAAPLYAAVMEQNGVNNWYQSCGIDFAAWRTSLQTAQQDRYILKAMSEFGPGGADQLYCVLYYYNEQYDKWTADVQGDIYPFQTIFDSETTKPFWRPYILSMGENQWIESAYTDTDVGIWDCVSGLTHAELAAATTAQTEGGLYPIYVIGGGTGSATLFTAIFAQHDIPTPRSWRATGTTTGFANNAAAEAAADAMIQTFMQETGVRQAQFAVSTGGNILLERAYSWSESTRHTTVPTDTFLLANLTQIFLNAAIQSLYNIDYLTPETAVYPLLGHTSTSDPRLQDITVAQLLENQGGTDLNDYNGGNEQDVAFDPMCNRAYTASGGNIPVCDDSSTQSIVNCMVTRTLDYTPGTTTAYSNYGFILLSYVIEHLTGGTYYDYLWDYILYPGGYNVAMWPTAASEHANDPVTQESKWAGISPPTTYDEQIVAFTFGGDGMCKEAAYGDMSLASSASTVASFIGYYGMFFPLPYPNPSLHLLSYTLAMFFPLQEPDRF
jgi:CubicO group peptidase (beta-lactamase class C family)